MDREAFSGHRRAVLCWGRSGEMAAMSARHIALGVVLENSKGPGEGLTAKGEPGLSLDQGN